MCALWPLDLGLQLFHISALDLGVLLKCASRILADVYDIGSDPGDDLPGDAGSRDPRIKLSRVSRELESLCNMHCSKVLRRFCRTSHRNVYLVESVQNPDYAAKGSSACAGSKYS